VADRKIADKRADALAIGTAEPGERLKLVKCLEFFVLWHLVVPHQYGFGVNSKRQAANTRDDGVLTNRFIS